jgi:K+-sensing histidine kinase KdpD
MKIQILAVLLLISIIPMLVFSKVIVESFRKQAIEQRVYELQSHGNTISNLLLSSGLQVTTEAVESSDIGTEINQIADVYLGRVIIVNRNLQIIEDTYELEVGKTIISEVVIKALKGSDDKFIDEKNQYVELTIPITDTTKKEVVGVILISFSMKNIYTIYDTLNQKALILLITISILILLFAVPYVRYITGSFRKVVNSIKHITDGYMDETVSIQGFTEVEQISDSFNKMMSRLRKLEASRQEFVSNVSHELKTPITSIKVLSDSLLLLVEVPAELYREFLVDIAVVSVRVGWMMSGLVGVVWVD